MSSVLSTNYTKQWVHLVGQRSGNTLQIYVNGVLGGTQSVSGAISLSGDVRIGGRSGGNYTTGSISNVRILKGTALYTTNFTPPTKTLTNVTNTKLLCCQSNTSATTAAVIPTGSITANGNAAATNFNPFTTDINAVRGQETGYCTLNPLAKSSHVTVFNGNLECSADNNAHHAVLGTFSLNSGKWYYEMQCKNGPAAPDIGWHQVEYTTAQLDGFSGLTRPGCIRLFLVTPATATLVHHNI